MNEKENNPKPDKGWSWKKCFIMAGGICMLSWAALPLIAALLHQKNKKKEKPPSS